MAIPSNKETLDRVQESCNELLKTKPEIPEIITPKLEELENISALQKNTKDKGERIFYEKCAELYEQWCDDIDSFAMDLERQM